MMKSIYLATALAAMTEMYATQPYIVEDNPTPKKWRGAKLRKPEDIPLAGRNEQCPCGSGKKYKKCCLK